MIPGFFAPAILPQPLIRFALEIPSVRPGYVLIPSIVDTGAAFTCIHALDAIRYFGMTPAQLDPSTWANPSSIGGIGGSRLYLELPANYVFRRSDNTNELITGVIRIGEMKSAGTPSLLGWDLLKYFKMEMDGAAQTISLTRVVP